MLFTMPLVMLGLASLLLSSMVYAEENHLSWHVQSATEYDSNSQLSMSDKISLASTRLQAGVDYSKQSAVQAFSASMAVYDEKYNRSEYDFRGYFLNTQFQTLGETYTLSTNIDSTQQSTLISEQSDTGQAFNQSSYRLENAVSALWQQQLNRRNSVYVNALLADVHYENAAFADYRNWSTVLGWQHQLTTLTTWKIQASYSHFQSELNQDNDIFQSRAEVEAETQNIQLSLNQQFTERLRLAVALGYSAINNITRQSINLLTQPIIGESNKSIPTANIIATYEMLKSSIEFEFLHNTEGSGSGSLTELWKSFIRYNRSFSATSRFDFRVFYSERKDFIADANSQSREYYNLDAGLQKQLNQQLTSRTSIGYRAQTFSNNSERPESYSVKISLQYRPYPNLW